MRLSHERRCNPPRETPQGKEEGVTVAETADTVYDVVVLGGGNVRRFATFPEGIEPGQNENAFFGGLRLWETKRRARELKWRVL